MNNYLNILNLKNCEYIYEEDYIDILTTQLNISITDSIHILNSLDSKEAESIVFSIINTLDISERDKIRIGKAILDTRFTPLINKNINTLFEESLISMIDVYTKNTNGYVLYKAQALCILSMLANQLPMYFKSYRDISSGIDETDIKLIAHKSISLLEEDYPKLSMRLNAAISKSNWCNERLYLSYINHPEIMANEFVRKKINI